MTVVAPVVDAGGRRMLRLEVRNAETPIERKPEWIKTRARMGPDYTALQLLVNSEGLHTVCQITQARAFGLVTKSNLILGMGETRQEMSQALRDLHDAGCERVTITQYVRPSVRHHPVERWVKPEEFVELKDEADQIGFGGVMSGPLVRSSYRAGRLYQQAVERRSSCP